MANIEALGAYRLPVSEELVEEQYRILYGHVRSEDEKKRAMQECREQLQSVALIEVLITGANERFHVGDFTQPQAGVPRSNWQVAYDEAYLSSDGESLLSRDKPPPGEPASLRLAFFLHFYNAQQPILSSYGEVKCPALQAMPQRLRRLVPYRPVD